MHDNCVMCHHPDSCETCYHQTSAWAHCSSHLAVSVVTTRHQHQLVVSAAFVSTVLDLGISLGGNQSGPSLNASWQAG